ncbi:hypothetical protein [Leifsonia sp. P73]|uniref:hypothetical protein n=1 Tax=Leifsonia sp. P73 TaxID=3423959 RepID=UPI003DA4FC2C
MMRSRPKAAFRWWRLPAAGVGLARMEFIVNNAEFLVAHGIDSISLNPDSFLRTVAHVAAAENTAEDSMTTAH